MEYAIRIHWFFSLRNVSRNLRIISLENCQHVYSPVCNFGGLKTAGTCKLYTVHFNDEGDINAQLLVWYNCHAAKL